jgi:hypothetical protein
MSLIKNLSQLEHYLNNKNQKLYKDLKLIKNAIALKLNIANLSEEEIQNLDDPDGYIDWENYQQIKTPKQNT